MSTCNRVILETMLGFQLIMPKNLPSHWFYITVQVVQRFSYELAGFSLEDFLGEFATIVMR